MWLVAASGNGESGLRDAAAILRAGGHALDAVEAGILPVESNAADMSVGLGGLPNVTGQVELDASIMDGNSLAAGAVGALQGYEHPISIARRVMQSSPHVMLVGEGARRFAAEMGFPEAELLTRESQREWRDRLEQVVGPNEVEDLGSRPSLLPLVNQIQEHLRQSGTVTFIALDSHSNLATGVSSSGWPWKYPGRLGDSPLIGAGSYADNRYGAAACIGYGELAIRLGTARSVVLYLKMGLSLEAACLEAMSDVQPLLATLGGSLAILAVAADGQVCTMSNASPPWPYLLISSEQESLQSLVPLPFHIRAPGSSLQ